MKCPEFRGGLRFDIGLSFSDLLGNRLEKELEGKYKSNASLCYICSGNVEKFVESL